MTNPKSVRVEGWTCHDWPVEKAIVDLPMRLKENSKRVSGNSSSPLAAQNKDYGASSETLLTKVELRLRRRRRIVPCNITLRRARSGKGGGGGKNGAGAFFASLLTERVLYNFEAWSRLRSKLPWNRLEAVLFEDKK